MAEEKISEIKKCVFTAEWKAPNGSIIYYHELTMADGTMFSVGKKSQYPNEIAVGQVVTYKLDDNKPGKGHIITDTSKSGSPKASATSGQKFTKKEVKQTDYLGYSYAYAKDLVVAGKTTQKDIDNLKSMALIIYTHIGELIKQSS